MSRDFDCLAFKHEQAMRIYEETRDMSLDEELAYWRAKKELYSKQYPDLKWANHATDDSEGKPDQNYVRR